MYRIDSLDTLVFAREQTSRLRADWAADGVRRVAWKRRPLSIWLRNHLRRCQVDRTRLAPRSA